MAKWVNWRDIDIDDLVIKDHHRKNLKRWLSGSIVDFPNLLLVGPYGTGKTTIAKMVKDAFSWNQPRDIDVQSHNLRDLKKDADKNFSSARGMTLDVLFGNDTRSLYFYDEFNHIAVKDQNFFHVLLEKGEERSCAIFATNHLDQTSGGIASRCKVIDLVIRNKDQRDDIINQMTAFGQVVLDHFDAKEGVIDKGQLEDLAVNNVKPHGKVWEHDVRKFVQWVQDEYENAID